MCECVDRRPVPDEFWTDFCVLCGRIWVNEFTGDPRRTEMFHPISKPMDGVWIGHTFIRDKTGQLADAKIPATTIPVIGTMGEDGQVKFKEPKDSLVDLTAKIAEMQEKLDRYEARETRIRPLTGGE